MWKGGQRFQEKGDNLYDYLFVVTTDTEQHKVVDMFLYKNKLKDFKLICMPEEGREA